MTLEDVRVDGHGPWSFHVEAGERVAVIAGASYARLALLSVLSGRQPPATGRMTLLGEDVYAAPEATVLDLLRQVGVVRKGGGLVSNLRAWENIVLPVAYHSGQTWDEIEPRVRAFFDRLGLQGEVLEANLHSLPGLLPEHWRRVVGLVRALIMEPRLMVYEALLDGLPGGLARAAGDLTAAFHAERPDRTSVFVVADGPAAFPLAAERTIDLQGD